MTVHEDHDQFVQKHQALIQTLANTGVRLEAALRLLSVISSLTALPVRAESLTEVANDILEILVQGLYDIQACSLLLYEPRLDLLKLLAARGQADILGLTGEDYNEDLEFRSGEGIAGRVFADNNPMFWDVHTSDPALLSISSTQSTPPIPGLSAP